MGAATVRIVTNAGSVACAGNSAIAVKTGISMVRRGRVTAGAIGVRAANPAFYYA